ncbi:MAG: nuclear transport factor 2 family protein [Myxococcota bacterium]
MSNDESTALIVERQAVIDVLSRYARGIDRRDADLYRSCLTDRIDVKMAQMGGPDMAADDWVTEAFTASARYTSTQHLITNHDVQFPDGAGGDRALCVAYLQAQHWTEEESMLLGGRYDHELRRENGAWRLHRLGLHIDWVEMTPSPDPSDGP